MNYEKTIIFSFIFKFPSLNYQDLRKSILFQSFQLLMKSTTAIYFLIKFRNFRNNLKYDSSIIVSWLQYDIINIKWIKIFSLLKKVINK